MKWNARLVLIGTVALAVMAGGVATASAYTALSVSPGGSISQPTAGSITFSGRVEEFTLSASCSLTLRGTLETTPVGTEAGAQIGLITAPSSSLCSGGTIGVYLNLPWRVDVLRLQPEGAATAPEAVTGIEVEITPFSVLFTRFSAVGECLWSGPLDAVASVTGVGTTRDREGHTLWRYTLGQFTLTSGSVLTRGARSLFCPETVSVTGALQAWSPAQELRVR